MKKDWKSTLIEIEFAAKAMNALKDMADEIKSLSQSRCPVDTGTLRGSAYVEVDDTAKKVYVGYGGAASSYALKQHENLHYHHAVGQAKFLESAFIEVLGKAKKQSPSA